MTHSDFNHLLASVSSLSPEQARQLRHQLERQVAPPPTKPPTQTADNSAKPATPASAKRKPLTADEFNQQLFAAGRIASLPDPALDIDDDPDDVPVPIKGEPLSKTILRERR